MRKKLYWKIIQCIRIYDDGHIENCTPDEIKIVYRHIKQYPGLMSGCIYWKVKIYGVIVNGAISMARTENLSESAEQLYGTKHKPKGGNRKNKKSDPAAEFGSNVDVISAVPA